MFKEEPIPLIQYDQQSSKYTLTEQAATLIQSITNPIAVVSVAGLYRTGKSYLLNRVILNRSNGFGVGPTVNPCTKGLWLWGQPITIHYANSPISLLIVDSEGTGAFSDSDNNHDTRVFALSVLLGSIFVYNSVGAIDEQAIEALGLVVNLTKFIQLKSQEDIDSDQYALFMPQFFWVLRDFSLQLLDSNGDFLTPHQYLEKSLQEQPGFSDDVEQKNRIRRLLTTFFPERDCFTLVRPVMREDQLQQLEKIPLESLRPEFYEQSLQFRKILFSRIRPKTIKGQPINGPMYVNLIKSYLTSINNGVIPNIETSWSYVFKEECQKALAESQEVYEKTIKENLFVRLPTLDEEVRLQHRLSKERAIEYFTKRVVGDNIDPYLSDLKHRLKQKFYGLSNLNEKESLSLCSQFLQREFAPIDRKLKTGDYKSFQEFDQDLKLFNQFLSEHGPKVANRKQYFTEFLHRVLQEGAQYFLKALINQSEIEKTVQEEFKKKSENEIKELKNQIDQQKFSMLNQASSLEKEKNELKLNEKRLMQNQSELKLRFEQQKNQAQNEKTELTKQLEESKRYCIELEEENRKQERQVYMKESEANKQQALLEQKIIYLQRQVDEYVRKERNFDSQSQQKEFNNQLREAQLKFDNQVKELTYKLNEQNEKNQELNEVINHSEQKFEFERKKYQTKEQTLQAQLNSLQQQLMKTQASLNQVQNENLTLLEENAQKQKLDFLALQEDNVQLKLTIKALEQKLNEIKSQNLKEMALKEQSVLFLNMELDEKKKQILDIKKAHDQALSALEISSANQTQQSQISKQIVELKEQHLNEVRLLEQENLSQQRKAQQQIDALNKENQEIEMKYQLAQNDIQKSNLEWEQKLKQVEENRSRLTQQLKDLELSKSKQLKDSENRLNLRIKQLEKEIEEYKQRIQSEGNKQQMNAEQQITELRNFYEMEKDMLERRIQEERQKADQKYQTIFEEQELKMREEQQQYEDEIEQLKEEIRDYEIQISTLQQQMEHDNQLKNQQIESIESMLNESKEQLSNLQNTFNQQLEQRQMAFEQQQQQLEQKMIKFGQQVQAKEKENVSIVQQNEELQEQLKQKKEDQEQLKEEINRERQQLNERLEEMRKKYTNLCDEYLEKKINYEKCIALSSQQNEFFGKKVDELEKQLEVSNSKYEERLSKKILFFQYFQDLQKQEWSQELNEKLFKINEEKQILETKATQMKKQLREKEQQFQKSQQELEKEQALANEKIHYLENKIKELESLSQVDSSSSSQQIISLKEQLSSSKKQFTQELEQLKQQCYNLEIEKSEMNGNYEKDKILWEGKFKFLESQRDQMKEEHSDAIRKFELTMQQLQKARSMEKNEQNSDITEMLASIERRYQDQVNQINNQYQIKIQEYEDKMRKLEQELKSQQDKELLDSHGKMNSSLLNERKISELLETEKKLYGEIEILKQERDQLMQEHLSEKDKERDNWKAKFNELEDRIREQEKKHSQSIFFHEKERAKWNLEKDHLVQQRCDLQDQVQRLEKKKELLLRENEKMKNSSKSQRKYGNANQTYMGGVNCSFAGNVTQRQLSDKKILQPQNQGNLMNKFDQYSAMNSSYDMTKSIEDEQNLKENTYSVASLNQEEYVPSQVNSTQTSFGNFKKYYQMMNSKQASPEKQI